MRGAFNVHQELTTWNVYFPSRSGRQQHNSQICWRRNEFSRLWCIAGSNFVASIFKPITPYSRGLNNRNIRADGGLSIELEQYSPRLVNNRLGRWCSMDSTVGLLIITPVIHPFNRENPGIANIDAADRILMSESNAIQWPTLASMVVSFPGDSSIYQSELVHEQFIVIQTQIRMNTEL